MSNNIHIYQNRHLFQGDDYIGKFNASTRAVTLDPEFEGSAGRVKSFISGRNGVMPRVTFGKEAEEVLAPLPTFPPEIVEQMTAYEGHRSPAALEYAKKNFTRAEFLRLYGYELAEEQLQETEVPGDQDQIVLPNAAAPAAPKQEGAKTKAEKQAERKAATAAKSQAKVEDPKPEESAEPEHEPENHPE